MYRTFLTLCAAVASMPQIYDPSEEGKAKRRKARRAANVRKGLKVKGGREPPSVYMPISKAMAERVKKKDVETARDVAASSSADAVRKDDQAQHQRMQEEPTVKPRISSPVWRPRLAPRSPRTVLACLRHPKLPPIRYIPDSEFVWTW